MEADTVGALVFTYCCYTFLCAVLGRLGAFGGFHTHPTLDFSG